MTSRIHRGFHRLGVMLAVPVVGVGLWLSVSEWRQQADAGAAQAHALAFLSDADLERLAQGIPISTALPEMHQANFTVALLVFALALALYAAARAVGWVLDGFMSPQA